MNFLVFSGVGFGAYCAVDFALVMDVLPNDREKAKDLAVWHQVSEQNFIHVKTGFVVGKQYSKLSFEISMLCCQMPKLKKEKTESCSTSSTKQLSL